MKTRFPAALAPGLLALFQPLAALAQQSPPPSAPPYYMPYWHGAGHMWGGGFGWGGPLLLLGLIAVCIVIVLLVRRSCCGWHHGHRCRYGAWPMHGGAPGPGAFGDPTYSALQILNERFARGEIQKPEYEEKKAAILSGAPR